LPTASNAPAAAGPYKVSKKGMAAVIRVTIRNTEVAGCLQYLFTSILTHSAMALERGFGIDPSPKLVAALKDAMRDPQKYCGSFTLVAAESITRRSARARRAAIPVQGPPPPVDGAEARDDGAAFAVPIDRWGKTRLFTLDLDETTDAYRIATERVQAIIDEEFGGEVTIRQRTAIRNNVLLGMFSEDLIVQHLSGQPRSSRRRVELVNEENDVAGVAR
jgi:hypothetical protein